MIRIAFALVAFATTIAVYWSGLYGGFIFDDYSNLVLSDSWKVTSANPLEWRRVAFSDISGPAGRPLALLTFAINHYLTGMDPFWFKFTSLGFHLLNGALVWLLCKKIFAALRAGPRPGILAAGLITCAWMLHPLQVSSVLYVVQRMELGAQTGVLLALLAYLHGRTRQIEEQRAWPWLIASMAAVLFGLGFKESAALAPGFAFLLEACVLRFAGQHGRTSRIWVAAYGAGAVMAIAVYVMVVLPLAAPNSLYAIRDFGPAERLLTQLPVLAMYLKQILLPWPDSMWFYYDNFPISRGLFSPPATALAALVLIGLATAAALAFRRWPLVTLGIGWFFMGHALTSNVIPLELAFEHRNYLALLGILLALAQPLMSAGRRLSTSARTALAALPVLGLAALCAIQAATWGNPLRLALALENRNPDSPRASYDLGMRFLLASGEDASSPTWSLAKQLFERGAALPGASALPLQGLLLMQGRAGLPASPETWEDFRSALTLKPLGPESLSALHAVSNCHIHGQCQLDDQQLLETFLAVMKRNPESGAAHTLYANFAWNVLGDHELALNMQRTAVDLAPTNAGFRIALAKFLLASGEEANRLESLTLITQLKHENRHGLHSVGIAELEAMDSVGAHVDEGSSGQGGGHAEGTGIHTD